MNSKSDVLRRLTPSQLQVLPAATSPLALREPPEPQRPIRYYWAVLRRHSWKLILVTLLGTAIVVGICAFCPEVYEGTALINVDRQSSPEVMGDDRVLVSNDADQFMATQVSLIQSDVVLRSVAQKYDLLEKEHQFRRFFLWRYSGEKQKAIANAPIVLKKLRIERPPNTYVIAITYKNSDPQLAADVANAVADSYLQNLFDSRVRDSGRLTSSMEQQLVDFKAKMEKSNRALMTYQRQLGVVDPEQKTNILVAYLQALNAEYANSEGDRIRKEAAYNAAKDGSVEGAQISNQADDLSKLTVSLSEAKAHFAEVKSSFGPNHPEYRKAYAALQGEQTNFEEARKNITQRIAREYTEALNRQSMLQSTVKQTKAQVDDLTARSFDYARLKNEAQTAQKLYEDLFAKIEQAGINAELQNSVIRLADSARPAAKPLFPNWLLIGPLSTIIFCFAGATFFLAKDVLNETARDAEHLRHVVGVDVLCNLPKIKQGLLPFEANADLRGLARGPLTQYDPKIGLYQESIRRLRSSVFLANSQSPLRSMLMTSALPAEGKSTLATFLAISHSEQHKKTLLVDADLRRPVLHRLLGVDNSKGLSDVLLGSCGWQDVVVPVPGRPHLFLIASGPESLAAPALLGAKINEILRESKGEFDFVILDSAPLLGFAETLEMACAVDTTILATHAGQTSLKTVEHVVASLQRLDVAIAGIVLNMVPENDMGEAYYRTYKEYYARTA